MNKSTRRCFINKLITAEKMIKNCQLKIESMGSHIKLTDSIVHLEDAFNSLADYVDEVMIPENKIIKSEAQYSFRLLRQWSDWNQTTGTLQIIDNKTYQPVFSCTCIERGERNNTPNNSRVIADVYPIVLEYSPAFEEMLWEIKDTPGRSEAKIHVANKWKELEGCIAPGLALTDLDSDGYYDVTSSRHTLNTIHRKMGDIKKTTIEIIDEFV